MVSRRGATSPPDGVHVAPVPVEDGAERWVALGVTAAEASLFTQQAKIAFHPVPRLSLPESPMGDSQSRHRQRGAEDECGEKRRMPAFQVLRIIDRRLSWFGNHGCENEFTVCRGAQFE